MFAVKMSKMASERILEGNHEAGTKICKACYCKESMPIITDTVLLYLIGE